jgi:hypothetical protein
MDIQKKNDLPIDKIRNSAGMMEIETPEDDSPIAEIISLDDRLLVVKGKGIYEIKLADQIDPGRTNIETPNTIQCILPYGVETTWIGSIVLTADKLFNNSWFPQNINGGKAFILTLQMAEYISSAFKLKETYTKAQTEIFEKTELKFGGNRSFIVPSLNNVESTCYDFIQKIDHTIGKLCKLIQLFYPNMSVGRWDEFIEYIKNERHREDNFVLFLNQITPLFKFIRNTRNCVEHPKPTQIIKITNFRIDEKNILIPPMLEVVHPETSQSEIPLSTFLENIFDNIIDDIEMIMAFLCERKVQSFNGLELHIIEIPEEQRQYKSLRYRFGAIFNGQLVPFG